MKDGLKEILRSYKNGEIGEAEAERLIDSMSIIKLSHTSIDAARERRCGGGHLRRGKDSAADYRYSQGDGRAG